MSLTETPTGLPKNAIRVKSAWQKSLLTHLLVIGPGLIVMEADNDAGAVSSYTQAGGQYGLHLLWLMLVLLPVCYFMQEMVARLGIATGQGHAAMIYKRFGNWWGRFSLADLLVVNFMTLVTEFAIIALVAQHAGLNAVVVVPVAAVALIALVLSGSYLRWERITLVLCIADMFWLVMAGVAHAGLMPVLKNTLIPSIPRHGMSVSYITLVIAIIGTTIAPWQLFFQQSAVADKKLRFQDLKSARIDTFVGSCFTCLIAGAMMVMGNVLFVHHIPYTDPAAMADSLGPIVGSWARVGVLIFCCNAAVLGTTAVSLASAWAFAESKGWPHSLQMPYKTASGFYNTYALCVLAAAALVLIPNAPLQAIIIGVQVLAGLILPSAIIFLQLLLNDRALLGEQWVNKPWNNVVNWTIIVVLFGLSLVLALQVLMPQFFPQS
jgi:Mn2+/Fe2+ NRAMP family transporter